MYYLFFPDSSVRKNKYTLPVIDPYFIVKHDPIVPLDGSEKQEDQQGQNGVLAILPAFGQEEQEDQ